MKPLTIAIDGPAASGKSTLGYHLARHLDYCTFDTGVLYRAVTWAALHQTIPIDDEAAVTRLAETAPIAVLPPTVADGRQAPSAVGTTDITWDIRSPEVKRRRLPVSAYPGVRAALTQRMRAMAAQGRIVMVGRDIGTVVLPDADLKLYVVASDEARAQRRHAEMQAQGKAVTYEEVLANLRLRDAIDSSRAAAPLKAADDAVIFDTTRFTIEEMFGEAERLVKDRENGR
jgi:cytidylate kinase